MNNIKTGIENYFEKYTHTVYRHKWLAIIPVLLAVIFLASQLPELTVDTSTESFLHEDDPTMLIYNEFRREFGRDEFVVVAIESSNIFTLNFLKKLEKLHNEIEDNVPYIDDMISLVNARNTRGEDDQLIVGDLLEEFPETEDDLALLKNRVFSNRLYLDRMISKDGRFTVIGIKTNTYSSIGAEEDILEGFDDSEQEFEVFSEDDFTGNDSDIQDVDTPFLTDEENSEIVTAIYEVTKKYEAPDFKIHIAGSPVILDTIKRSMMSDVTVFMKLAVITIGICLFLMFRRLSGVVFPLIIVAFSLLSTLGIMALTGVPFTLPINILPSFIISVGIGASVHILVIFYHFFEKSGDREDAIAKALGHSGLAVVMTSLTTAAGLVSFSTAELAPIGHLGIFAGIGVILALINTLIFLPAMISLIPIRKKKGQKKLEHSYLSEKLMHSIADFSTGHAKSIVLISFIIIIAGMIGASRLTFSHNHLFWLPDDLSVRTATEKLDKEMRGTVTLEVIVDTGKENGLYDVAILNKMEELNGRLESFEMGDVFVGKITSLSDILKEIHQALNENREDYYKIPQNPELIPQEFLLFENSGSDDLEDVVDSRFSKARITIKVPWGDSVKYLPFLLEIEKQFKDSFKGRAEITTTGLITLLVRTLHAAIHSMAKSYVIAFVVITFMMIILIGNIRMGLLSMIPNLAPVIITLGIIGWFGFIFDMFTMLIGSIAIGLAVDDTVHFMHNFSRYYGHTGDVREGVRRTLKTTGRAMLVTSIVLTIGFFIFMFASMNNLFYFGLLTGIAIIIALLSDYLLAPALVTLVKKKTESKRRIQK